MQYKRRVSCRCRRSIQTTPRFAKPITAIASAERKRENLKIFKLKIPRLNMTDPADAWHY
jgi:hypothetical protein